MGLDAIVFRSIRELEKAFGSDVFELDPETGEAIPKPDQATTISNADLIAAAERLGNMEQVRLLRERIALVLREEHSVILERVLYSGTHSGDLIRVEDIPKLRNEMDVLIKEVGDGEVLQFVAKLDRLISSAEAQRNPIVFS